MSKPKSKLGEEPNPYPIWIKGLVLICLQTMPGASTKQGYFRFEGQTYADSAAIADPLESPGPMQFTGHSQSLLTNGRNGKKFEREKQSWRYLRWFLRHFFFTEVRRSQPTGWLVAPSGPFAPPLAQPDRSCCGPFLNFPHQRRCIETAKSSTVWGGWKFN